MSSHHQEQLFIGKPKLRESQNRVKIWEQTMTPYPREFFHMGRLRFPRTEGRWGFIEEAVADMLVDSGLSKMAKFTGNIPWKYYQNHFNERPQEDVVKAIESFIQTKRLGKAKLRKILSKHKFRGLPDLISFGRNKIELWEVKAPLDDQRSIRSLKILEDLSNYGFSTNILYLNEFGKTKTELTAERTKHLKQAQNSYSTLVNSEVGDKVLKNIIAPALDGTTSLNSLNHILSKYESGVSYFVYALVYYIERAFHLDKNLRAFTLTQNEIIYLSRMLFLSGSYHWWRIPLLYMSLASDDDENDEYIDTIKNAVAWEKRYRTLPNFGSRFSDWGDIEIEEDFFINHYYVTVTQKKFSIASEKAAARLAQMRFNWAPLYYSRPLR